MGRVARVRGILCVPGGAVLAAAAVLPALPRTHRACDAPPASGGKGDDVLLRMAEAVPADAALVVLGRPPEGPRGTATQGAVPASGRDGESRGVEEAEVSQLALVLAAAEWVSQDGRVFTDIAASLPLLGEFPFAVVLLDISAQVEVREGREQTKLRGLRAAAIFETGGRQREVLVHVNRLVTHYANSETAEVRRVESGAERYVRLRDRRLPGWAVLEWGALGERYVVAIGAGTFEAVAAAHHGRCARLGEDAWYAAAHREAGGRSGRLEWTVDLSRLRGQLKAVTGARWEAVVEALGLAGAERDLWVIGTSGRVVTCRRVWEEAGRRRSRTLSGADGRRADALALAPTEATWVAALEGAPRWLLRDVPGAWIAGRHFGRREAVAGRFARLQAELGVSFDEDVVGQVGPYALVFDYPAHPLEIPVAVTVAMPIADAGRVRTAVDRLLGAWRARVERRAATEGSSLTRFRVRRDADGVWYLQAGLVGPALQVVDGFALLSWSPRAVREAAARLEAGRAGTSRGAGSVR